MTIQKVCPNKFWPIYNKSGKSGVYGLLLIQSSSFKARILKLCMWPQHIKGEVIEISRL